MRLLLLLTVFWVQFSYAENEFPTCEKTYFKSGELSTKKCYDKDNRFGKAYAYTKKGKLIYEKDLRKIAGHASVDFEFYPNGAIKKVHWSSAPDSGIQWYNSVDYFSEDGIITSHTENNYDDYTHVTTPYTILVRDTVIKQNPIVQTKKDTIITSKNFIEVWCVNHTYFPIIATAKDKKTYVDMSEKIIQPGDSIKIIQYKFAKEVNEPNKKYRISVTALEKNKERNPFIKTIKRKKINLIDVFYYVIENKSKM